MKDQVSKANIKARFRETYLPQHPNHFNPVGGLHLRKATMTGHNEPLHPLDRRQLVFYSIRGSLPPLSKSPIPTKSRKTAYTREANLHACAHLYASDRNSLFIIPNHLDLGDKFTRMASLSHTVIFHVDADQLFFPNEPTDKPPNAAPTQMKGNKIANPDPEAKERKWFMQESWTTRVSGGRGLHTSRLWDPERGVHLATIVQDGLVRFEENAKVKL
jgi:Thioesterase-like superfamily